MKKYCINCGSGTEFSSIKPKFCSACGHNFDVSFATNKIVQQIPERKIKPNISINDNIEIDDDDFDDKDINHVPNIDQLNVDYEVQKYQGVKFNKMLDNPINASLAANPTKKEKIKGKKISKKEAKDFFDNFSKEAGALRPKNKSK
jgi:hypothetical protein